MKTDRTRHARSRGYLTYLTVLSLGIILVALMISAYRTALQAQEVQKEVGLRVDYADKEDAVLRGIVSLLPNRAIRAMQQGSDQAGVRDGLRWQRLFSDALDQANARTSITADELAALGKGGAIVANSGDSSYDQILTTFDPIEPDPHTWDVSPGTGRLIDEGRGYPPLLDALDDNDLSRDRLYPIISSAKRYGARAQTQLGASVIDYSDFNILPYPEIHFGYAQPGEGFVAKHNWWAVSIDLAQDDSGATGVEEFERDFIISLYEIPSQLAISAEAFTMLGQHGDGSAWQNTTIEGGVFSTRATVADNWALDRVAGRRGLEISASASIGTRQFDTNPFEAGVRETYEIDHGEFMPVYLSSESGRAAFVPINRGAEFFDRYALDADSGTAEFDFETNTLSSTTWNEYSVGALQCAVWIDITDVVGPADPTPTEVTMSYLKNGVRETLVTRLDGLPSGPPPAGYIKVAVENQTVHFDEVVDLAYGKEGRFYYQQAQTGDIVFNNARFGDPYLNVLKDGYYRPSPPFSAEMLHGTRHCLVVYPERLEAFLDALGADDLSVNHSVSVNVDHTDPDIDIPSFPAAVDDYGLILRESGDLSAFPVGFSLVSNLRMYLADDFNVVATSPPVGSGLPEPFYPPSSLFAPEKRYGGDYDPLALDIGGQVGSLAGDSETQVNLLDMTTASGAAMAHDRVTVNLSPIAHPAALPPVTMMNWLVVVKERRRGFHAAN